MPGSDSKLKELLEHQALELRASEARFHNIVTISSDGIVIVDEVGLIRFVNPAAESLFGRTAMELLGGQFGFPIVSGQTTELDIVQKGNKQTIVEMRVVTTGWEGKNAYLATLRDITERKHSEATLRASEERHRTILQTAMDGFWLVDMEGRLLDVNEAYCRMSGYSLQKLLTMHISDLEAAETAADTAAHLQKIVTQGEDRFETRHIRKNGRIMDVEVSAHYLAAEGGRIVVFLHDISARKRADAYREMGLEILKILNDPGDLQGSIQRILSILKKRTGSAAVGIRLQEGEDFPYFAREGFSGDFLRTEDSLISRSAADGVCRDQDGNVSLACTCGLVISGRTDPANQFFTPGGSFWTNDSSPLLDIPPDQDSRLHPRNECIHQGYASVALSPIRNGDRIVGLIQLNDRRKDHFTTETVELLEGIAAHIGAALMRKQAGEEIARLNTDLAARAVELESANIDLEAFNYSVSHDLRRPLSVINGYCQVVLDQCGSEHGNEIMGYVREMYEGTLRMNRLMDALFAFSSVTHRELHFDRVDLSAMANVVAAELQLAEPEREVSFRIATGITADCDAALLRVVLDNLIGNAWKYTGHRLEAIIEFGVSGLDGKQTFFVRDNGPGFDMADKDRLFIPFQRLPGTNAEGHGIGLATVQRIINRHGGRVWAEGEIGRGATFYFTLSAD